jgi:hypothetical protein
MILYIIKWTLLYSILIFLIHNLYLFFKSNLTNTKIKDYYSTFSIEKDNNKSSNYLLEDDTNILSTSLNDLNNISNDLNNISNDNISNDNMKNELNEFLQKIKP